MAGQPMSCQVQHRIEPHRLQKAGPTAGREDLVEHRGDLREVHMMQGKATHDGVEAPRREGPGGQFAYDQLDRKIHRLR